MGETGLPALVAVVLSLWPVAAAAQSPAGSAERELAQAIRQAGYDCPGIASVEVVPSPQPDSIWQGPRPEVAVCRNGKRYLVARSGRNRGSLPPVVRPLAEERKL